MLLFLLTLVTTVAAGQDTPRPSDPGVDSGLVERIVAEEQDFEVRRVGLARLRASRPQVLSAGVGVIWARLPKNFACVSACEYRGPIVQIEPGIGGGQLSAGYAFLIASRPPGERFLSDVFIGAGIKGSLLRTWSGSTINPSDQTFVGAEGEFTITRFNFSLGALYGVSDNSRGNRWRATFGFGWGF